MTMFFAKKLNKKGFTLAELLVVVAIIAVLVAIAIPIFTNSIDEARLSAHKANARALKAIGVEKILSTYGPDSTDKQWTITGTVDTNGNIKVTGMAKGSTVAVTATLGFTVNTKETEAAIKKESPVGATYVVGIEATDLESISIS